MIKPPLHETNQGATHPALERPQHRPCQHIGGIVDIEIQPGKSDQRRQNQGREPQLAPAEIQSGRRREGGSRMPGGEGKIVGAGNQQLYCRVDVSGTDAGHKGLQKQITAY